MRTLLVSQRQDRVSGRNEVRDSLDSQLVLFLSQLGFIPLPVPNNLSSVKDFFREIRPAGLVLSGGNTLGENPDRDATENQLLELARDARLPVLGICRGMQMLNHFEGGTLQRIAGHLGKRHEITSQRTASFNRVVNSFHDYAINELAKEFTVEATSSDGIIEAISHVEVPWLGIMWHPERENPFDEADKTLISSFFSIPNAFQER
jgi:gamma-glutamyl-gamma-aminobutyrate hydrolase PuuD